MQPSVFRSIAESASDAIVVTAHDPVQAPDGPEIIFVNDAWVRMTGYSREEAIGKTPRILQGPETDTAQTARIRQAISENRPVEVELVNYRKNGEPFWSWVQIFPISDRSGDNCYWAAIKRDITRQKHILKKLEKNSGEITRLNEELELFFNSTIFGAFFMMNDNPINWNGETDKEKVLDQVMHDLKVTRVNDAFLKQYGMNREEMLGRSCYDFFEHDPQQELDLLRNIFDNGIFRAVSQEKRADGSDVTFEGDYESLLDEDRNIVGIFGIQKDITLQRQAEQALEQREQWFRSLVQEGVELISVLDGDGTIIYVSPSIKRLGGYKPSELLNKNAFSIIHPDDREMLEGEFGKLLHRRKIVSSPYRMMKKNGKSVWLRATGTNLLDNPDVNGIVVNSVEITEEYYLSRLEHLEKTVYVKNAKNRPLGELLDDYLKGIEQLHEGMVCSVIEVRDSRLHQLSAPGLDPAVTEVHNGLGIDRNRGSCGEAARLGKPVIVRDIATEGRWKEHRDLFLSQGLRACWSHPVFNSRKEVVAIFAIYRTFPSEPDKRERNTIERTVNLLQIVLENRNATEQLRESNLQIRQNELRLKQNLQEKETLIQEIHHRVKNNLAIVSGMLELQTINEKDETSSVRIQESVSRIKMIAGIHELLYQSDSFSRIDIKQSIESLTLGIRNTLLPNGRITFRFRIGEIDDLNINQAIPFALIINEVIANSIKHAYPDGARGEITLSLAQEGRQIVLEITDNGSGLPESFDPNAATSTGMQFIRTLTAQLKCTWRLDNRKEERGAQFRLEFLKEDVKGAHSAINDFIHESKT